jgi:hypothetical protein
LSVNPTMVISREFKVPAESSATRFITSFSESSGARPAGSGGKGWRNSLGERVIAMSCVATSTTGLTAGAASMKVKAAAPATPSPNSRRATGTDPHSQPGSAAPETPAARMAAGVRRGDPRASRSGDSNTVISPLTTTPKPKDSSA